MKRKIGLAVMLTGVLLVAAAFALMISLQRENIAAKQSSDEILQEMMDISEKDYHDSASSENNSSYSDRTLPDPYTPDLLLIDTHFGSFIGYITVPDLNLILPVFSDWDYSKLTMAPCCYSGSVKSDDLVIAAHNYTSHFGNLYQLKIGDEVFFTDADHIRYTYTVKSLELTNPDEVDKIVNNDYSLTLFTCTYGGESRVTVFCEKQ